MSFTAEPQEAHSGIHWTEHFSPHFTMLLSPIHSKQALQNALIIEQHSQQERVSFLPDKNALELLKCTKDISRIFQVYLQTIFFCLYVKYLPVAKTCLGFSKIGPIFFPAVFPGC